MGAKASVASFLLSIVVATPCMRKNFCVPPEAPRIATPAPVQHQPPSSPVKPASGVVQPTQPCPHRAEMQPKSVRHGG